MIKGQGPGTSRRSNSTSERYGTMDVRAISVSVVYCSTVRPSVGEEPGGGSRVRDTASEREACE